MPEAKTERDDMLGQIAALNRENQALAAVVEVQRAALRPFADLSIRYLPEEPEDAHTKLWADAVPTVMDLHRARAAMHTPPSAALAEVKAKALEEAAEAEWTERPPVAWMRAAVATWLRRRAERLRQDGKKEGTTDA